ncbi:hypothetical protein QAD02_005189 [Eretmocerus hayati]|uniref:Uncharacterized protein n=1 Tax=Eretmocerus hayati TaxID=131215 RepID=A0ACC2NS42_9HYME|nr:hypothetical protein QAD02_005189 [Eretmocerus hayati]
MPGQCAGSVIGVKLVLTATHCLFKGSQRNYHDHVKVLSSDGQSEISYYFANVIPFPSKYEPVYLVPDHDIAVIVLSNPIQNIQPISLPPMGLEVPPGAYAQAFGWGSSDYDTMSWNLRSAYVMTITCYNNWYNRMMPYICIDSSISSTCPGDSGGPLIYGNYLVGIVSRGIQPCGTGTVIFTKVAQYIQWLNSVTSGQF